MSYISLVTHPALEQMSAACDRVRTRSRSRRLQVDWILRELTTAMDQGDLPPEAQEDARVLLSYETLTRFLTRADTDAYRARGRRRTTPPSTWTALARRGVLRALSTAYLGYPIKLDNPHQPPPSSELPDERQRRGLWSFVADAHLYVPPASSRRMVLIRMAAIVGITLDTSARPGEVATLSLTDLLEDYTRIRITHVPQGGIPSGEQSIHRLSPNTTTAIKRWLRVRAQLTEPLEGASITALWVTVRAGGNSARRINHTCGLPLSDRTLREGYVDVVRWLNEARADDPLWEAMPTTLEQLRLSGTKIRNSNVAEDHGSPSVG